MPMQVPPSQNHTDEKRAKAQKVAEEVQRLLAYFKAHSNVEWMPFPADSLVPRTEAAGPPLLNSHLHASARASLAMQTDFPGDEIDLFRVSIQTWNSLHPTTKVTYPVSMLTTWGDLMRQEDTRQYSPENEYLAHIDRRDAQEKIATAQRRYENRDEPTKKIHSIPNPYQRNLYTGTCSHRVVQEDTHEIGTEATVNVIETNPLKAHDKWALLQRFWFKQLHSHHGFIMGKAKTNLRYHRAALGVLTRLAELATDHELGRTATGLSRPDLVPDFANGKAFKEWNEKLATTVLRSATNKLAKAAWPEAFRPATVGHPAVNLQRACEIWQRLGYPCSEINAVHRLAHEVASLMTDPWACNHLNWSADDLVKIAEAVYEARIKGKNTNAPDPKVDDTDRIERAWASTLVFRHYTRWAGSAWTDLQLAVQAIPTP